MTSLKLGNSIEIRVIYDFLGTSEPTGYKTLYTYQQQLDLDHKHLLQPASNGLVSVATGLQGCQITIGLANNASDSQT